MKKNFLFLICTLFYMFSVAQPAPQVNVLSFSVKPQLLNDISAWQSIPAAIVLVVQPIGSSMPMVKPVFSIMLGSTKICGNTQATANFVNIAPTHSFTTAEVIGNLTTCPKLQPGNYTLCVKFYGEFNGQQSEAKEFCREFRVENVAQNSFCNPPQNINPTVGKIFTEKDFQIPKTFNWTPLITSSKPLIIYRLTVWEIEDGQSEAQAMYDNFPVLQEDVRGITRYTSKPSTWERRNATYVWRVEALDQEGRPICKTNLSVPTQFKIQIQETIEENIPDSTIKKDCCKDSIIDISKTINAVAGNLLNIVQNFTLAPNNITKINAEILSVTQNSLDTSCRKCSPNEAAVWNFMPMNKAIWNSGVPNNGAPNNASGSYPAQNIIWYCNAQGNLKFDLKIALPGKNVGCKINGKVLIKYSFTNADCSTCTKTVSYDYTVN